MAILEEPARHSRQIQKMFSVVAPSYDFLNRLLSAGRDRYWRKSAVDLLAPKEGNRILDVATGTADIALEIASPLRGRAEVLGIDFSGPMLDLAMKKVRAKNLAGSIKLQSASAENLPFADGCFDGVITAFGIRNFPEPLRVLEEMRRVLKRGGRMVVLEFSHPPHWLLGPVYNFYFESILPMIGRIISGHEKAYSYLPCSVKNFPVRTDFARIMEQAGFVNVTYKDLTFGIVTLYKGFNHG